MTKHAAVGILLQTIFYTFVTAHNGSAQQKSLKETYVSVSWDNINLSNAFIDLERKTGFEFSYNDKRVTLDREISLQMKQRSLKDVLVHMAGHVDLQFKRINGTIHVNRNKGKMSTEPPVADIIEKTISGHIGRTPERIDYFMTSLALSPYCKGVKIHNGEANDYISDHYPVEAIFEIVH